MHVCLFWNVNSQLREPDGPRLFFLSECHRGYCHTAYKWNRDVLMHGFFVFLLSHLNDCATTGTSRCDMAFHAVIMSRRKTSSSMFFFGAREGCTKTLRGRSGMRRTCCRNVSKVESSVLSPTFRWVVDLPRDTNRRSGPSSTRSPHGACRVRLVTHGEHLEPRRHGKHSWIDGWRPAVVGVCCLETDAYGCTDSRELHCSGHGDICFFRDVSTIPTSRLSSI